jgi:ATP-dependent protease ClpP protease subunit
MINIYFKNLFLSLSLILGGSLSVNAEAAHTMLDGIGAYSEGRFEIISDIEVSGLKIRHVRSWGLQTCSENSQHYDFIEMSGPINPDTPYIIEKLLKRIKEHPNKCTTDNGVKLSTNVILNSGGGFMKDGYKLGEVLRDYQATTYLGFSGECYSSCATAFLGGYYRTMGPKSNLMFHAPYRYQSRYDIVCSSNSQDLKEYMQKMLNSEDGAYLYDRTMSYCSQTTGWSLNKDAADIFGLLR